MNEFLGLAYYAEVPAVLFDIQRVGPSTGMPTRTQQCDILEGRLCVAWRYQTCVPLPARSGGMLLFHARRVRSCRATADADHGDVGPRHRHERLDVPDLKWDDNYVPDRGKVLSKEEIAKLDKFHRYLDVDGDGIPYRTLPGVHPKGAYFTRGSGHTQYGVYTEDSAEYQVVLDRLTRKFNTAKRLVPKPIIEADAHIRHRGGRLRQLGWCGARGARYPRHPRNQD
jgi:2-oxoglutarate ferredoxin oxidoreductase subunit alpha